MTVALRVVGFTLLAVMVGWLVVVWRYRTDAQADIGRDRRVDRALQRGHVVAEEDRCAAPAVLRRTVGLAGFIGSALLSQVCLHLADHGTSVDGLSLVAVSLSGTAFAGVVALTTRMLLVGRRQGLHPGRPWRGAGSRRRG